MTKIGAIVGTWRGKWEDHPAMDWLIITVVVSVHAALDGLRFLRALATAGLSIVDRVDLYRTVIGVSGTIVGFALAAAALFYSSAGDRVIHFRRMAGPLIARSWVATIVGPLLAIAALIVAVVMEGSTAAAGGTSSLPPGLLTAQYVAQGAFVLLALRFGRLAWPFREIMKDVGTDSTGVNGRLGEVDGSSMRATA